MGRTSRIAQVLLTLALGAASAQAQQRDVFVRRGESEGRGILRASGTDCMVLTPRHVVEGATGPVEVVGEGGRRASGSVHRTYDSDLAVVRLAPGHGLSCPDWRISPLLGTALARPTPSAVLLAREATGAQSRVPVSLRFLGDDRLTVRPASAADGIQRGMSGSELIVDGLPAGMLTDVEEGEGVVLRMDAIGRLVQPVFDPPAAPDSVLAEQAIADLSGRWIFSPESHGAVTLTPSGGGYRAVFSTRGNHGSSSLNDHVAPSYARVGDVVFTLDRRIGGLKRRRYANGTIGSSWIQDYEVTVYYYELLSGGRCQPGRVPGLTGEVSFNPSGGQRFISVNDIPWYHMRYDVGDRECRLVTGREVGGLHLSNRP